MDAKDPVFRLGGLFRLTLLQVLFFASIDKYLRMSNYAHASISTAGADGSQYESEGIGNPTLQGTTKAMSIVYFYVIRSKFSGLGPRKSLLSKPKP